jgi:hypothetical protein
MSEEKELIGKSLSASRGILPESLIGDSESPKNSSPRSATTRDEIPEGE